MDLRSRGDPRIGWPGVDYPPTSANSRGAVSYDQLVVKGAFCQSIPETIRITENRSNLPAPLPLVTRPTEGTRQPIHRGGMDNATIVDPPFDRLVTHPDVLMLLVRRHGVGNQGADLLRNVTSDPVR